MKVWCAADMCRVKLADDKVDPGAFLTPTHVIIVRAGSARDQTTIVRAELEVFKQPRKISEGPSMDDESSLRARHFIAHSAFILHIAYTLVVPRIPWRGFYLPYTDQHATMGIQFSW